MEFNELKGYIGDDFEYEDMKEMDWDYGSLNLINIKNQYEVFMSQLPEPLKDSRGRLYIGQNLILKNGGYYENNFNAS